VVGLVAELETKLEADRELALGWCERLEMLSEELGFDRTRIWLIAREGFTPEADQMLSERGAFASSRRQLELLTASLDQSPPAADEGVAVNDFEMVVPMGGDYELIAAHTAEQIARRLNFTPSAINQIKHAVVEACINASEHSLSPDQKIYQRFRVESDKLVITISSRGIVPPEVAASIGDLPATAAGESEIPGSRRGWGLKIIRTLMDEVDFEPVDDGTCLRMTKYLR